MTDPPLKQHPYGPLLTTNPLTIHHLPAHSSLPTTPESTVSLSIFANSLLSQGLELALQFIHSHDSAQRIDSPGAANPPNASDPITNPVPIPKLDWTRLSTKSYNKERVALFRSRPSRSSTPTTRKPTSSIETWFARLSHHPLSPSAATGPLADRAVHSFADYRSALQLDHSRNEASYSPEVTDAYCVACYDFTAGVVGVDATAGVDTTTTADTSASTDADITTTHVSTTTFKEVQMSIYEMVHVLPAGLSARVFPVVVVSARLMADAFVVVQVPVDLGGERSKRDSEDVGGSGYDVTKGQGRRGGEVVGRYVSVEYFSMEDRDGVGTWVMATSSDAGGWLPGWVQRLGVPRGIAKDVPLVLSWLGERKRKRQREVEREVEEARVAG